MNRRAFLAAKFQRVSSYRVAKHGPPPELLDVWWHQMIEAAQSAGVTITWEEHNELAAIVRGDEAYQPEML